MILNKEKKEQLIKEFGGSEKNTGAIEVQVAVFPAASVLVTTTSLLPSDNGVKEPLVGVSEPVSTLQFPAAPVVRVYVAPPAVTVTVLLGSAVPVIIGVISLVT